MCIIRSNLTYLILGVFSIFTALFLSGCEHTSSKKPSVREHVPHSLVGRNEALFAAKELQAADPKRVVGWGKGDSMAPIYSEHTLLVTAPVAYEELEAGMIVAYQNSQGRNVVHVLVRKRGEYWIAQGLNNAFLDEDVVTPENLIGVVYATFQSKASQEASSSH